MFLDPDTVPAPNIIEIGHAHHCESALLCLSCVAIADPHKKVPSKKPRDPHGDESFCKGVAGHVFLKRGGNAACPPVYQFLSLQGTLVKYGPGNAHTAFITGTSLTRISPLLLYSCSLCN